MDDKTRAALLRAAHELHLPAHDRIWFLRMLDNDPAEAADFVERTVEIREATDLAAVSIMAQTDRLNPSRLTMNWRNFQHVRRIDVSKASDVLARLGFNLDELRAAIQGGKHRSAEQADLIDALGVTIAASGLPTKDWARILTSPDQPVNDRQMRRYAAAGRTALNAIFQLIAATSATTERLDQIQQRLDEQQRRQFEIMQALGLDPVAEAEAALRQVA